MLAHPEIKALPSKEKRWALIIGIDEYERDIASLKGAVNDATALRNVLVAHAGFPASQVILLTSAANSPDQRPTRVNILDELNKLSHRVPTDGLLLFSFSGHGVSIERDAYLIPSDGRITKNARLLRDFSIDVRTIQESIREINVKQVLVLLDACRNDPGRGDLPNPLTETFERGFSFNAANSEIKAFSTLYAASRGQRAFEFFDKETNQYRGYFSYALEEGMKGSAANGKGEITLGSLTAYIENTVPRRVRFDKGESQQPFKETEGYKESELVLALAHATTGSTATSALPSARLDIQSSTNSGNSKSRRILLDGPYLLLIGIDNRREIAREFMDPLAASLKENELFVEESTNLSQRDRSQMSGDLYNTKDKTRLRWLPYALILRIFATSEDLERDVLTYVAKASVDISVFSTESGEIVERYDNRLNPVRGYGSSQDEARRNALRALARRTPDTFIKSVAAKAK